MLFDEAGSKLYEAITEEFDLDVHELALLAAACHTADTCSRLQAVVDAEGELVHVRGEVRAHPALVELRAQRILLARLLVALRVPLGESESGERTQRRGIRGVYGIRGSVA
ncbi:MAG: hypothetical protein ABI658_26500 [Acidimicrobiales bacterium]